MLTALNYWLYARSHGHQPLQNFATNTRKPTNPKPEPEKEEPIEIDTHINQQQP